MAEIKVTTGDLTSKASELRNLNNQFKKAVEDMTATEQQLMGMWDGDTKDAFHNAYNSDKVQMDAFYDTIEKYCQALENNAQSYKSAEEKTLQTATTRSYK